MPSDCPVVVHLVHGTWPYGFFRKKFTGTKTWFEENSDFREALFKYGGSEIDVKVLHWSGKNSVISRREGARKLHGQIKKSIKERPASKHVVVAHSHGGTVAADALSWGRFSEDNMPHISALVCLATPFAYVRPASDEWGRFLNTCLTLLIISLIFIVDFSVGQQSSLLAFLVVKFSLWTVVLLLVGFFVIDFTLFCCTTEKHLYVYEGESIDPTIKVFLIRATRDEAAISLGLAEAVQGITATIGKWMLGENLKFHWDILKSIVSMLLVSVLTIITVGSDPDPDNIRFVRTFAFLMAMFCAIPCFIVVVGRAAQAYGAGLPFRCWGTFHVEVDVAPPKTDCTIRAYSRLSEKWEALRHGIYDFEEVQKEVGRLIKCVALGENPTFSPILQQSDGNDDEN